MDVNFLRYHEPGIVDVLVLISFFVFLPTSTWLAARTIRAGVIGPIILGMIYGRPLANILRLPWQETYLALGYVGLIFIIFEGGLSARLDLLRRYLALSFFAATIGILTPIGFSYLLLYLGYGYGAVETFVLGAALSSTSLGTTFAVISATKTSVDLKQTRVGTVLVSAALIDDIVALVMSSVIQELDSISGNGDLGWLIGRPIVASVAMAILTPLVSKYTAAPLWRRIPQRWLSHKANFAGMLLALGGFLAIAAYAGTSMLFGAFLAGAALAYLSVQHPHTPSDYPPPPFHATWTTHIAPLQTHLFEPLFFASIGTAIPFLSLWDPTPLWRGVLYALLMLPAKAAVGAALPLWARLPLRGPAADDAQPVKGAGPAAPLLGAAMVARGEIGLLILQLGFSSDGGAGGAGGSGGAGGGGAGVGGGAPVSREAFVVGVWAVLLNTIIGPVCAGLIVGRRGEAVAGGVWGVER